MKGLAPYLMFALMAVVGCGPAEKPMTGADLFDRALDVITQADIKFQEVHKLDELDADVAAINAAIDSCIARCDRGIKEMNSYSELEFPKSGELIAHTVDWLEALKALCTNELRAMVDAYSRPEDTWSTADYDGLFAYADAYEAFREIDSEWVAFQDVYAAENDMTFTSTVNVNELVEEEMGH